MKRLTLIFSVFLTFTNVKSYAQEVYGIDVSYHQGDIDWNAVANDGKVFAWVKATEGYTYDDPNFQDNMTNGQAAGVVMGAYHFARPDNNSATDEANHFLSVAGSYIGDGFLPPVLDLEDPPNVNLQNLYTSSELTAWVQEWIDVVVQNTGVEPIIYTNGNYANYLQSSLNSYGLWIADPDGDPSDPPSSSTLGNWNDWKFKQYSWSGTVSGINTSEVDLNVFNGTTEEFENLIHSSVPGPENDDCANAITLQSSVDCNPVLGTVNHAHPDSGFAPGSCDAYSGTPLGAGVFYKFVATHPAHTITIDPLGDLDAVVILYHGNDCNNLTEVQCEDTPGGGGVTTIMNATGLTVGDTYYIRVYDYGSINASNGDFNICITNANETSNEDVYLSGIQILNGTNFNGGDAVIVKAVQNYDGNSANVQPIVLKFYLSEDCSLDSTDIFLSSKSSNINVNNPSDTIIDTLIIPTAVQPGNYHILFETDATNVVDEIYENNNLECEAITIDGNASDDIYLTNLVLSSITANPGDTIFTGVTVNYVGSSSNLLTVYVDYFLSQDNVLDANDIQLSENFTTVNSNITTSNIGDAVVIPENTVPGTYYLILQADPENTIYETNEYNNTLTQQLLIQPASNTSISTVGIKIYPNPILNILNVEASTVVDNIQIFNSNGKLVLKKDKLNTKKTVLHLSNLLSGVYYIKITTIKGFVSIRKIVKE